MRARASVDSVADVFVGDSDTAQRGRATDWAATPLGPVAHWPPALRAALRLVLASPVAMSLWCGPTYTLLYNDAYRRVLGAKHPPALGHSGAEVFAELWETIRPQFDSVRGGGPALALQKAAFTLARGDGGSREDAWFDYALSPVHDDAEPGAVVAVLSVVTETTTQVRVAEALEAERARSAGILETMADAHFVLDAEFRFVSANAAMERNVAQSREQLVGRVIWEVFPGVAGTIFERSYRRVVEERVDVHFIGEYDEAGLTLVPEVDAYPTAEGGVAVFWRDIAPRRRAEAALEESERQFRTIVDAIPTLAWTARADGYIDWYNARWYAYTGTTPEEMEGWGWQSVHDPAQLPEIMAGWQASIASGDPFEMTFPLRGADGRFRRFLTRVMPLRDAGGRVLRWFGTNADVEAERAAREAAEVARADAEAAESRLRDVFEQAPVAVAVLAGPDHVYTIVSPPYQKSPGAGRVLLGRSVREAFPELADSGYLETMDRVYETGVPYSGAERRVSLDRPDGQRVEHYFNIGYQPLRDAQGQVYAIASVAYDVSEQVRARHEVEAARVEAERQRVAAETANAAKSQFLSTMSHELRTPLNAIGGYAQLLTLGLRGPLADPQRQDIERIRQANQHLTSLVTDVLNFARLDAGKIEYHLTDVELATVIAEVEPLVGPQLAAKGLAFDHDGCTADTPDEPHRMRADPEKLRQILLNLLTNAVKFTDAGRVTLSCATDAAAGVVRVRVSDTGRGIPADQLERIFEPFVQVDRHRTHESQQGVGLGLAISRDLARGMGGELAAESEEERGSTFTVTLQSVRDSDDR